MKQEAFIKEKIQQITYRHPYYGYPIIATQFNRENIKINYKRALRPKHQLNILARIKCRYKITTNYRQNNRIYPNLIKDFLTTGINHVIIIASRNIKNLINQSDKEIQYTCKDYFKILKDNGIGFSICAKSNHYDKAFANLLIKAL